MTPLIRRGAIQKPATQQLITTAWRVIPHVKSRGRGPSTRKGPSSWLPSEPPPPRPPASPARSLNLYVKARIERVDAPTEKGPHFRIYSGAVELGAALQKTAKDTERDYLAAKVDDPSFPNPIYATLAEVDGQEGLQLIWSRSNRD